MTDRDSLAGIAGRTACRDDAAAPVASNAEHVAASRPKEPASQQLWPAAGPTPEDRAVVAAMVRQAGSSFYWAMRLQPRGKRDGLFAVYGFCRVVDDIADGDAGVEDRAGALAHWSERIADLSHGADGKDALERGISASMVDFGARAEDFQAVIDGMLMDANGPVLRPDWTTLTLYCDRVASAVGRLCIRVFGESTPAGEALATAQGQALQLTNIIRDVADDAALGRIYVPREILSETGLLDASPTALAAHPNLQQARAHLGARADRYFAQAKQAAAACDPVAIRPAMMMMDAYEAKFRAWQANDWQPPANGILRKLTTRAALAAKASALWLKG